MSDSAEAPILPSRSASTESRHTPRVLFAIALALVVLHVARTLLSDLPLWDEAAYMDWGRHFLIDGWPLYLAASPGYSFLLGALSLVFGPVGAIRIAAIGGAVAFGAAVGSIAFLVWRTSTARWLATVIALGSAHAFSGIGIHRTSITLLLLGCIALAGRRPRMGLAAFLLCSLGAYLVRPEAVWAVPFLPLAIWRLSPTSRPSSKVHRRVYLSALTGLWIAGTLFAAREGADRNWFAFAQHYAAYRQPQLTEALGPSFSPWFDFEKVLAIDFPGAHSLLGALYMAPALVLRFMLANAKTAAILALGSMVASPAAPVVLVIGAALAALAVATRARPAIEWRGLGWFMVAMGATSAMAIEVVSNSRHVIGLSIALGFGLGLIACGSLAGRRSGGVVAVAAAVVSLCLAGALSRKEIRYAADLAYPAANMMAAVQRASRGRPIKVAGMCNCCVCAYASNCLEIGPAQGYTAANQCALFEGPADIVVLRIEAGAEAPPCGATGHRMLGRWPAIGMEVWGRDSHPSE